MASQNKWEANGLYLTFYTAELISGIKMGDHNKHSDQISNLLNPGKYQEKHQKHDLHKAEGR